MESKHKEINTAIPRAPNMNAKDQKAGASVDSAVASRAASDVASTDGKEATPLMFLNEVTRKFDSWEVSVNVAHMEEYNYM